MNRFEIIYVDDDLEDLDLFAEAVNEIVAEKNAPIGLTVYNTGNALINYLNNGAVHHCVIFLDINMPGKNGFEVVQRIKETDNLKQIPVIMYSTSSEKTYIDESYRLGAHHYVIKPDNFKDLKAIIGHVINIDWTSYSSVKEKFVMNPVK